VLPWNVDGIRLAGEAISLLLSVCLGLTVFGGLRFMTYHLRAPRIDYLLTLIALVVAGMTFIALEFAVWGE